MPVIKLGSSGLGTRLSSCRQLSPMDSTQARELHALERVQRAGDVHRGLAGARAGGRQLLKNRSIFLQHLTEC